MSVERANPLPVGWYWVVVPSETHPTEKMTEPAFNQWLATHRDRVRVAKTAYIEGDGGYYWTWYLFAVREPVEWLGPGYAERAPLEYETSPEVVASAPIIHYPLDELATWITSGQATEDIKETISQGKWLLYAGLSVLGFFVIDRIRR